MAELSPDQSPAPWVPISNPRDLKVLGKFIEETNEGGKAAARCIIQGVDEADPETGKVNRAALQDEVSDILANCDLVIERFALDRQEIAKRKTRKFLFLSRWLAMLPARTPCASCGLNTAADPGHAFGCPEATA